MFVFDFSKCMFEEIKSKQKQESDEFKKRILGVLKSGSFLFMGFLLVLITPLVLGFLNQDKNEYIRENIGNQAQINADYFKGRVENISSEYEDGSFPGQKMLVQEVEVLILEGEDEGRIVDVNKQSTLNEEPQKLREGETIVLIKQDVEGQGETYYFMDKYHLDGILLILAVFIVMVVLLAGSKGVGAFFGLVFSGMVLVGYLVPEIITGQNVVLTTLVTGILVITVSMYLSHGVERRVSVAIFSSVITIFLSLGMAIVFVEWSKLSGVSSEEAMFLQMTDLTKDLSLRGLLLAGMIIGSLGVLDDVTSAQATAVEEISKANPDLSVIELFWSGMRVGREHAVSMVNTLAMAYVGSSLPLLLLFAVYNQSPLWVILNNEMISEEIVSALVGSVCLLLSVPIVTFLSAKFLKVKTS